MQSRFLHIAKKTVLWVALTVITTVVLIPVLVYVPFIQDFAKEIALKEVKKSTGMDIAVERLRIKFPLKVSLGNVRVIEASGDTMATLGSADIKVKLLPLFKGSVEASGVDINKLFYQLGTPDSALWLRADVDRFTLDGGSMAFRKGDIDIGHALLDGGKVRIVMKDTVTPEKTDTAAATPYFIKASDIRLKNLEVSMSMLPVIDTLGAVIPDARLHDGLVDMRTKRISAGALVVDSILLTYLTPSAEYLKNHPAKPDTVSARSVGPSELWTITANRLGLSARSLTYGVRGARPLPGFDMNHIVVGNVGLEVDSFYNRGSEIRVPLRRLEGVERCGLALSADGTFSMDTSAMHVRDFAVKAGESNMRLDADMGIGDLTRNPLLPLSLLADASVTVADLEKAFPSMNRMLRGIPRRSITLHVDAGGTAGSLAVRDIRVVWPSYLRLAASGKVNNPFDFRKMGGKITLDGSISNVNFLKPTLLGAAMSKQVNIPPSTVRGTIDYNPGLISGDVAVVSGSGKMQLEGHWNGRAKGYEGTFSATGFPVRSFMPSLGVGDVTADISVKGHGYNPMLETTTIDAEVDVKRVEYLSETYSDIHLGATLSGGHADGEIVSHNPGADLDAEFYAVLSRDECSWNLTGDVRELDLVRLGLSKEAMSGSFALETSGSYSPRTGAIDATLTVDTLRWLAGEDLLSVKKIAAGFNTSDSLTSLNMESGDLVLQADVYCGLNPLLKKLSALGPFLSEQIAHKHLDVIAFQNHLPPLDIFMTAGRNNPASQYLAAQGIDFANAVMTAHNDSLVNLHVGVTGFAKDKLKLDNIALNANQHGKFLVYNAKVDNNPGTMDDFAHVVLNGFLADDKMGFLLSQHNIQNEQGFRLGFAASFTDSLVNVKMVPYNPVIAYQKWEVNEDNFISFNFIDKHLDANLNLFNDKSAVKIFTEHSLAQEGDSLAEGRRQEDVVVQLSQIKLADWLSISPFAPPVKGDLGANLRFRWDNNELTGKGNVSLTDLYYGRDRVGTFDLGLDVANGRGGVLHADVALMVDSVKVITASGALNDSTASNPFLLDFSMIHFPLRVVNPFLPKNVAQMKGMLNGNMKISGTMAAPIFNGYLDFDSTAVTVGMTGASYEFSPEKIPVDSNVVKFDNFYIQTLNKNKLSVSGTVDARHLTDIGINLGMKGSNLQIVNSSRPRGASLYGKAFVDLDATARGNLRFLDVNAMLNLLPETNVTYVMAGSESTIKSRGTDNMVTFVQFSDTTVTVADTVPESSMALNLTAQLTVSEGSTINVDISTDGKNKAQVKGMGTLDFTMNPMNDGRLTGRFNINSGFVRYTPPLMSEKNFKFQEGSYVSFNGDMMNPTLNIKAVDELKANVTQEGQNSRLVNFLVGLSVTNTLQNMNVAFDLSTNDDLTISNELQSMSPEQRANQAMNMLLYNVYTGPGTKGNANLSGNPLFSFLESQINTWAANNIRGVDISFGIDQYDKTVDGSSETATSYSYRVSKTLFNNRFKIVVGGNYSTDANADENFSQNLINDISFEYMLNRSGSMYVRLFRHVGYESILEGEVTQTGVGFVYRHKINSLLDLFRWGRRKKQPDAEPSDSSNVKPTNAK